MTTTEPRAAAERRADAARDRAEQMRAPADRPRERRSADGGPAAVHAHMRDARIVRAAGVTSAVTFIGYASITETPYTLWDMFGEYEETISRGAFAPTLAAEPLTEFVPNHGRGGGPPMAHTRNNTLTMTEDDEGLRVEAVLDPTRNDVHDLVAAIERGDLAEMSFRFRIVRGRWSDDYEQYFIHEVDLDRGDVSPVNFGANPHTYIQSPARQSADAGTEARIESSAAEALGDDMPAEPTEQPTREESAVMADTPAVEPGNSVVEPENEARSTEPTDTEAQELRARIADLEEQARIRTNAEEAQNMTSTPAYDQVARVGVESRTYRPDHDQRARGREFLTDVAAAYRGSGPARARLERHMDEERVERAGQVERATAVANFTGWVIPQYLVDLNAPAAVAGRRFANICRSHELPETGMTAYLSKITTGSSVADQASEGTSVSETDMDDTQITISVRTAAGSQTISRQAVERGLGVDEITIADLLKRYSKNLDSNLLNAATHGLTNVATSVAYTDASPTAAELYPKIQAAASASEGVFLDTVDGLAVVMHPRRWRWLSASMTSTWPFVSGSGAPVQSGAVTTGALSESASVRGYLPDGTPVITDANIVTTDGTGTNQDEVYVVAPEELHLWEDPSAPMLIRAETSPKTLQLDLVVYGYYAFYFDRYAGGHSKLAGTGLVTPTF